MQAQLTVRLTDELNKDISALAKRFHLKRSDIVRMALEKYLLEFRNGEEERPFEKVNNLVGSISSGISDLGESHRKYIIKKFIKNA